jgi:GGDEF domain-containing protein
LQGFRFLVPLSCRGIHFVRPCRGLFFASPICTNDKMLRETETMRSAEPGGEGGRVGVRSPPSAAARLPSREVDSPIFGTAAGRGLLSMSTRVERMLAQCRRQRGVMALVCVHLERIEAPDDALPEPLRRQVCADLVHRMRSRMRGSDLVVQETDGDAGVLMAGAGEEAARRVARRFAQALSGTYRVGERLVEVTVGVGHAAYPEDGTLGAELVRRALERMGA